MVNIISNTKREPKNKQEWEDIQQPLDKKTGYANELWDKLYKKERNPWTNTERDRSKKRKYF